MQGLEGGQKAFQKLKGKHGDELNQVLHLKTSLNERKFVFIQHCTVVQPHTTIPRLIRAPLKPHTARTYGSPLGLRKAASIKIDHSI